VANIVFNVAKGKVTELYNRVMANDPTNSALVLVVINANGATDATIKDYDTLALLIADALVAEVTNTGYARVVLHGGSTPALAALPSPDDTNDWFELSLPTVTWSAVAAGDAWTDIVVCYDSDTTAGTDANIVPLTMFDFAQTPSGSDIQMTGAAFYRAS
jgi:hypothetical protein